MQSQPCVVSQTPAYNAPGWVYPPAMSWCPPEGCYQQVKTPAHDVGWDAVSSQSEIVNKSQLIIQAGLSETIFCLLDYKVFSPKLGKCVQPLQQGPCGAGLLWVLASAVTGGVWWEVL